MRTQKHFSVCLSLLVIVFFDQSLLVQRARQRDLARYDDGGTFDFNWGRGPEAHETMRPQLREFLWQHWNQKRLGRVIVTFYTLEGDPTTYHFYIEPDANGRWHVVSEYVSECCWLYALEKKKRKRERKSGTAIYDMVERIEIGTWKVLSGKDGQAPTMYQIRLGNMSDKNSVEAGFTI